MDRRQFVSLAAQASVLAVAGSSPFLRAQSRPNVVVIGGGFGGATAARYLRKFYPQAQVTLIEPQPYFVSCPMSNRLLHGAIGLKDLSRPYAGFASANGLQWIQDRVNTINAAKKELTLASGKRVSYDRLIVSPGVDFDYAALPGMDAAARAKMPHAWKAGQETVALRDRLHALPDGATIAMHIPKAPYRCPPGPYERASLIGYYLKSRKPKSKLLVFDANPEILSKKELFQKTWKTQYSGLVEYLPNADIAQVDGAQNEIEFKIGGKVKADLWNVIPPQRAGELAINNGLANVNNRWCGVDFLSYESTAFQDVHVIGDSISGSPGMPKSGHMANQEGKVAAAAITQELLQLPAVTEPVIANTCYSFVTKNDAIHVAAVYRYSAETKQMVAVKGAGGLSDAASTLEGVYAMAWLTNILDDTIGSVTA